VFKSTQLPVAFFFPTFDQAGFDRVNAFAAGLPIRLIAFVLDVRTLVLARLLDVTIWTFLARCRTPPPRVPLTRLACVLGEDLPHLAHLGDNPRHLEEFFVISVISGRTFRNTITGAAEKQVFLTL